MLSLVALSLASNDFGVKFLEENKAKDGVKVLPYGLQYKVLNEGPGLEHPKVGTPCECHYAGRLLDGTEFDSSYKRGTPTTFAPNQVIKGWTEAMQLMVVGDKWEMFIPYQLAYGANGKPPKIPPKACLIFVMEIVKIKGETKPKQMVFPEWSESELALWLEKDEAGARLARTPSTATARGASAAGLSGSTAARADHRHTACGARRSLRVVAREQGEQVPQLCDWRSNTPSAPPARSSRATCCSCESSAPAPSRASSRATAAATTT